MEIIHENEYLYKMNDEIDSGENSCTALPGREAERRDYNQSWLYRSSAEI